MEAGTGGLLGLHSGRVPWVSALSRRCLPLTHFPLRGVRHTRAPPSTRASLPCPALSPPPPPPTTTNAHARPALPLPLQAELSSLAPLLLHEALEELVLGVLEGFAQVLLLSTPAASASTAAAPAGTQPATSPGGAAQLWLEGSLLLAAVGSLGGGGGGCSSGGGALQQAGARLRAALDARLEAAVAAAGGTAATVELAAWAAEGSGAAAPPPLVDACRRRLTALCQLAQESGLRSVAPLQQLAAAAPAAAIASLL